MPATYDAIGTTTLGSATQSITFSSIASTWTDLLLVVVCPAGPTSTAGARINTVTTSAYSWYDGLRVNTSAGSAGYDGSTSFRTWENIDNDTNFVLGGMWVFNSYKDTTMQKTIYLQAGEFATSIARTILSFSGGYVGTTAAINQVIAFASGTWPAGTMATLYGIARA